MPDVRDAGFQAKAADEIVQLLKLSQGRAFCLFTSYSQMNDLFERVRSRVSFPVLLQGTAPRFRASGTLQEYRGCGAVRHGKFWQGVDVPGEQLSCVHCRPPAVCVEPTPIVAAPSARFRKMGATRSLLAGHIHALPETCRGETAPQASVFLKRSRSAERGAVPCNSTGKTRANARVRTNHSSANSS